MTIKKENTYIKPDETLICLFLKEIKEIPEKCFHILRGQKILILKNQFLNNNKE